MGNNIFDELVWRGVVHQVTSEDLGSRLEAQKTTAYCGFDPTAPSLTLGHLMQMIQLRRLQLAGHRPIALAGGGTGLIGDPSLREKERPLLSGQEVESNVSAIREQLDTILDFSAGESQAIVVNNADWLLKVGLIDFLRDVGKHFTVNMMINKESVRSRIESRETGLSFTEFSYMPLQAFDFLHLFDEYGCTLQTGASDQWGNITAGVDLIRRVRQAEAFGITTPYVMTGDGTKMSKSEGFAIWLDASRTSPYGLYQWGMNADDPVIVDLLKYFTFRSREEITALQAAVASAPQEREAQKALAWDVTAMVHGEAEAKRALQASETLFTQEIVSLDERTLLDATTGAPSTKVGPLDAGSPPTIVDLLLQSGLTSSRAESLREIESGGIYVNNARISDHNRLVGRADLLHGKYLVLRRGKKNQHLVSFE